MKKEIITGSLESSDCLIRVSPAEKLEIELETVVREGFYEHIKNLLEETAKAEGAKRVRITCKDQGALDYTIKARLQVALRKFKEEGHG